MIGRWGGTMFGSYEASLTHDKPVRRLFALQDLRIAERAGEVE
jgi:hypothetical protein